MVKSYRFHGFYNNLKFASSTAFKTNKVKFFILLALIVVAMATGVFVAIKAKTNYTLYNLREINVDSFYSGVAASSSAFLSRSISLAVNVVVLVVLSFSPFLFPLASALFVFRAYLFGLNFALIFIFYGIGSLFTAVIIILPCGLITLFGLVMFYLVLERMNCNCKKFGRADCNRLAFIFFGFLALMTINLVETILLVLLNGKIILVI